MIDSWFNDDVQRILAHHPVAVFIDASGDAEFLLNTLPDHCTIHKTSSDLEELEAKYRIEKALQAQPASGQKFLVYTQRTKDELKFVREYCETHGVIEIRYLQNYIKDKVHQTLNLNINLPQSELVAAAKVSVGKDKSYWFDLSHKGVSEIFDLEKELLPFVHAPDTFASSHYDAQIRETFYRQVNTLLGQEYMDKPPATLASEVVNAMLDGLASNACDKTLWSVYTGWLDSNTYASSFPDYLRPYSAQGGTLNGVDIWHVHPDHPFRQVDEQWLKAVGEQLASNTLDKRLLDKLKQRHHSKQAQALGIRFWADLLTLLNVDSGLMNSLGSLSDCIDYYKANFSSLDTAIRNLYTEFLNQPELLEPFQTRYKELVTIFMDKWFRYFDQYQENQTGTLQRIIDQNTGKKIAVIVGDAVAYEVTEQIALQVKGQFKLTRDAILADYPSETENNMSHIYMDNGSIVAVQGQREKYLTEQNAGNTTIDYLRLDEVNDQARAGQVLICTYKDIDDLGDKIDHKALKFFPGAIAFVAEKVSQLLNSGYNKVYLISDHGFVLTGMLSEADKIVVKPTGEHYIDERFVRTAVQQPDLTSQFIERTRDYNEFSYLYFAQTMNPFKTPGTYGFSHGGLAPQELITPYFCWEKEADDIGELAVSIANKSDLSGVAGDYYQIKLEPEAAEDNLFTGERKVVMVFFAGKQQVNTSDIITIRNDDSAVVKEYSFSGYDEIEVQLLDASTKQHLDRATVKRNNDRDLGGLL
ncbi:PglZ domain-containing protein [Endozoicomonas acroporae]|uniref:PglZ domain-containing protein n=1 Tax=Endozoicomonas acroporae TaxID=1701104 RepID=UPI000C78D550|nr:PglZ domain-containing protein [Endozoicomonas acroporae]